ncbi:MAG: hypothetical protein ACREIF_12775 [Chthoniobacterales bacterium]
MFFLTKVLKSSGDPAFDRSVEKTLGKWKLRRGPLVLELPLRFVLTPSSYSVQLARYSAPTGIGSDKLCWTRSSRVAGF